MTRGIPRGPVDPYDAESVAVYRLFNRWGALLYVGIAADPKNRLLQHECEKDWWWSVFEHTVTWYRSRAEAAVEESRAIIYEMPAHNIAGAQPCPPVDASELIEGWRPNVDNLNIFFIRWVREWSLDGISADRREYGRVVREAYRTLYNRAGWLAQVGHHDFVRLWDEEQDQLRAQEQKVRARFVDRLERRAAAERERIKRNWTAREQGKTQGAAAGRKSAGRSATRRRRNSMRGVL